VQLLLASGADVNSPAARYNGVTALQAACVVGDREVVEVLIRHGVDVNAHGSVFNGGTALHIAAAGGHFELVRRLLEMGADPNGVAGRARQTPLQSAFLVGRSDIIDLLRGAGASGPVSGGKMLFNGTRAKISIEHGETRQ
jgi:ankyrin repeat protein